MDSCGNGHISKIIAIEDTAECSNILSQAKGNMPHVKKIKSNSHAYNFSKLSELEKCISYHKKILYS